jgi:hypothetical protein
MNHHLRHPGCAGREQYPFGVHLWFAFSHCVANRLPARDNALDRAEHQTLSRSVGDHDVDSRRRDHMGQVFRIEIWRTQHEPADDAIELDQRERGRELVRGVDHSRSAAELVGSGVERRAESEFLKDDRLITRPDSTPGTRAVSCE